jgi:hypothetical protein
MAKLVWDNTSEHKYETGVSNGVLYVYDGTKYGTGVAWNGLTAVTESPSGAEATALYADDKKYLNLMSVEEFGATIEAYTYPDEFAACNGEAELAEGVSYGQQARSKFAFCYKTKIGSADNDKLGYKLHIIYGCLAAPSEKAYATVNDSPEAITFSWEITTTPVKVADGKYTACITIDSTKVDAEKLTAIEAKLFGTESEEPTVVLPEELKTMMAEA